jgi:hypothetical protein
MATGGTIAQDLTMQWSTLGSFMQDLSLLVIDEGQQYGTDREIAVLSLLKQQPLVLWTGDSQQTPGGIAQAAPNAKRSRQLLLAKKHGLRSDRNYLMPSHQGQTNSYQWVCHKQFSEESHALHISYHGGFLCSGGNGAALQHLPGAIFFQSKHFNFQGPPDGSLLFPIIGQHKLCQCSSVTQFDKREISKKIDEQHHYLELRIP